MAHCRDCGAEVVFMDVRGEPSRVAFDRHESTRGEGRYVESPAGGLVPVGSQADVQAWQRHSVTCGVGATV